MGEMLNEVGSAVGKAVEGPATLPVKIAENAFRTLEGKPFLSSSRHDIVDATWNVVAAPGRVFWSLIKGMSKGTLRLTWKIIEHFPLPLPMLDSWKKERGDVMMRTKDALDLFKFDVDSKFALPTLTTAHQQDAATAPQKMYAQAA